MNAKMPELKHCFEAAGFTNVVTVLSSGNVVFDARKSKEAILEKKIEKAMSSHLDRSFLTIVRSVDDLVEVIECFPSRNLKLVASKPLITFLKSPHELKLKLPLRKEGGALLKLGAREVYSTYIPSPKASGFLVMLEKTLGKDVTTRTLETVRKVTKK